MERKKEKRPEKKERKSGRPGRENSRIPRDQERQAANRGPDQTSSLFSEETVLKKVIGAVQSRKRKNPSTLTQDIMVENRLLSIICQDPSLTPGKMAFEMNQEYGYGMDRQDVQGILQEWKLTSVPVRETLIANMIQISRQMNQSLAGDREAIDQVHVALKSVSGSWKKKIDPARFLIIILFQKNPALKTKGDLEAVFQLGNAYASSCYRSIRNFILEEHERAEKAASGNKTEEQSPESIRIRELENTISTTNLLLDDLQNEFETQLAQSREKMKIEFFSSLNSEKYGMILDSVLELRKTAGQLRRSGFQVPVELSGLLIFVTKMAEFVRDSHIDPMLKPGSLLEVNAEKAEFYDYEGSPFENNEQMKTVRVLSPGWIYRDQEIQIARPRVREEK